MSKLLNFGELLNFYVMSDNLSKEKIDVLFNLYNTKNSLKSEPKKKIDKLLNRYNLGKNFVKLESQKQIHDYECSYFFSRYVDKGKFGDKVIFIKVPKIKSYYENKIYAKNDELAYLISSHLGLNVVPVTCALYYHTKTFGNKNESESENFMLEGSIIQEGVNLHDNQFHINQNKEITLDDLKLIDIDQVHRVILFNQIVGPYDATKVNSVIGSDMKIYQIDNERIGGSNTSDWTSDWLGSFYAETQISDLVVNQLLQFDSSIMKTIFDDVEYLQIDPTVRNNITNNFERIYQKLNEIKKENESVWVKDIIN